MNELQFPGGMIALVSPEDFDWLNQYCWSAFKSGNTWYAKTNLGFEDRMILGLPKYITMHRLIMLPPVGMVVDHIDNDGLNNQRSNLRVVTQSQNCGRRRVQGRSGYRGVRQLPSGRWAARITANIHIGTADTAEEAALLYDAAARERYGECALLNFPDIDKQLDRA